MYKIYCQNVWNTMPAAHRMGLIRSMILNFGADVCLFQECSPYTVRSCDNALPYLMSDEYIEVCQCCIPNNYTPVFYKKEKFEVIDDGYFLYDGLNDYNSKSVTWAVLKDKSTLTKFAVASTHFWWMSESENDNMQRLENVCQLHEICEKIVSKYSIPVIVGGDLNNGINSFQGTEPYELLLKKGFCDFRSFAGQTTDKFTHRDCHSGIAEESNLPMRNLDYIFYYGDFDVRIDKFDVLSNKTALESSDHCPLIASFEID